MGRPLTFFLSISIYVVKLERNANCATNFSWTTSRVTWLNGEETDVSRTVPVFFVVVIREVTHVPLCVRTYLPKPLVMVERQRDFVGRMKFLFCVVLLARGNFIEFSRREGLQLYITHTTGIKL
jgi:hypothetical protein